MKGKFRILGHVGLALFVACALMLAAVPAAKVHAATAVTNVWVQFLATPWNTEGATPDYTIHFTPDTALSRGVDTITVWFPDGSTAMGPDNFSLASALGTAAFYNVDSNGEAPLGSVECTQAAVLSQSGYRITITTPVDLAADTACSLLIEDEALVTCADDTSNLPYYLKVYTSKDTTPVASDTFNIDTTGPTLLEVSISPDTAGSASQYTFSMTLPNALTADTHTVTVIFPYGTTIPAQGDITTAHVSFQNASSAWENCTVTPTVNQKARMITVKTPITLAGDVLQKIRFTNSAIIKNPTTAKNYAHYYACTSRDELFKKEDGGVDVDSTSASQIGFDNDPYPSTQYSDSATMIYMYSSILYVQVQDAYGNLVDDVSPEQTISFATSQSATGAFYSSPGTQTSSEDTSSGAVSIYYKDSAAGTVTITATCTTYPAGPGTWTITISPGVELRDSSNNLIKTFAPTASSLATEAADVHSGDYIQSAIDAAVAGDTVKLGGTAEKPAIYELDKYLDLNKKITLTSATSASYSTIRPATEALNTPSLIASDIAVVVGISGTAANPVIIDGLTFTRLRSTVEFDQGVFNNGWNYVTVRNCTFNYIIPEDEADNEKGSVVGFLLHPTIPGGGASITSGTISDNTFTNCIGFAAPQSSGEAAVICIMTKETAVASTYITGITVSGNTLTDSNGIGITINGYRGVEAEGSTEAYITAYITDNTLTNPSQGLSIQRQTHSSKVLRNTVTGAYTAALYVEGYNTGDHDSLVIKNNTFTGAAGADKAYFSSMSGAVVIEADGTEGTDTGANTVQYNAIYDNDADYSIYVASNIGAQDCKYNYFGDSTGPYYSALAGATVDKSNTGGAGKKVTDYVTYYPWLHKSLTDVVNDNASYQASTMSLVSGWNTLSTPVQLISTANTIGDLIPAGMITGYWYDAFDADGEGDYWELLSGAYELSACDAVYVKMSIATDVLLKFDAKTTSTPSKELAGLSYTGWNLISLAYLSSSGKNADNAVASVYKTAAGLPGYAQVISPSPNATQTDMFGAAGYSWAYSSGESYASPQDMFAGLGYWIYMMNDATLAGFEITPIAPDLD